MYILSSICSKLCEELCCTRLGYAQIQMMFLDIQPKKKKQQWLQVCVGNAHSLSSVVIL